MIRVSVISFYFDSHYCYVFIFLYFYIFMILLIWVSYWLSVKTYLKLCSSEGSIFDNEQLQKVFLSCPLFLDFLNMP